MPSGGLRRREGSYLTARAQSDSGQSLLVPFVYSPTTTYVLEFYDQGIRAVATVPTEQGLTSSPSSSSGGGSSTGGSPLGSIPVNILNPHFTTNLASWGPSGFQNGGSGGTGSATWSSQGSGSVEMKSRFLSPDLFPGYSIMTQPLNLNLTAGQFYTLSFSAKNANTQNAAFTADPSANDASLFIGFSNRAPTSYADVGAITTDYGRWWYDKNIATFIGDNIFWGPYSTLGNTFTASVGGGFNTYTGYFQCTNSVTNPFIFLWGTAAGFGGPETQTQTDVFVTNISLTGGYTITGSSGIAASQLNSIGYVQSPSGLYVYGQNIPPYKLTYDGTVFFNWNKVVFKDGPYIDQYDPTYGAIQTNTTVTTAGGATGTTGVTVNFSKAMLSTTTGDEIGRLIRIRPDTSSVWGYGTITAVNSTTQCVITINSTIGNTTTSLEWKLGSWSQRTGYPRTSCFHEQRQVFGGTTYQPQTIWGSASNDQTNFAPDDGSAASNITELTAYSFTLATAIPELIQWLATQESTLTGSNNLLIGTTKQIHSAHAVSTGTAISARDITIAPLVKEGCAYIPPIIEGDTILFMQLYRRKFMEVYFDIRRYRHIARDLMVQSEHLSDKFPVIGAAYQQQPYKMTWISSDKGDILGLTYDPTAGTQAWQRQVLGGNFGGNNPLVESIITVPGATQDAIWMVVKRTINGSTVRTIEAFSSAPRTNSSRTDVVYLDASVTATVLNNGSNYFNITSCPTLDRSNFLSHLNGATIGVVKNGVFLGTDTVSNGLPVTHTAATFAVNDIVSFGLQYTSIAETNVIEPTNGMGHGPGKDSRVFEATLRLQNSLTGKVGYTSTTEIDALVYPPDAGINPNLSTSPTYTGDVKMKFPHGWERDTRIYITQSDPYPFTVSLMIIKMVGGQA